MKKMSRHCRYGNYMLMPVGVIVRDDVAQAALSQKQNELRGLHDALVC